MFRAILLLALCLPGLAAQATPSASAITARGRSMGRALDTVLGGGGRGAPDQRTLILLIDPSPAVKKAGFVGELRAGMQRNAERLAKTMIGVAGVGQKGLILRPGVDREAVLAAVESLLERPTDAIRNVYQDVRAVAGAFPAYSGRRELTLIALENGDAEDDLEATLQTLERNKVVFRCIGSESYVADSYWAARPHARAPRKCKLTGGDGAFVELPWGWLLQTTVANEIAPSSFLNYAFSRLAAGTKGSAHLYSAPSTGHRCAVYGSCLFCSNDHASSSDSYWQARLARYAPSTGPRREVFSAAANDLAFRAMLAAWGKASRAGLVRSSPSVKATGNGLTPQRARGGRASTLFVSTGFSRNASKATKLAKECERIRLGLAKRLAAIPRSKGIPRYRAMAEFTGVMLQLTKVNLLTYAGWCREVAPELNSKRAPEYAPPEVDPARRERRATGITFSNYSLCHGVRPFFAVELPGGKPYQTELAELDRVVADFEKLYGHTPLSAALHRSGIAHFRLTYPGTGGSRPRRKPRSSGDKNPLTERGRPARPGRSSSGSSGPTTGK